MDLLIRLIEFLIFVFLQSLFINGWNESFKGGCVKNIDGTTRCDGMIFYKLKPSFFEKHKGKWWTLPLWGCVKCESSVIGCLTFFSFVLPVYGFEWVEIPIFVCDVFILVPLNWFVNKKFL